MGVGGVECVVCVPRDEIVRLRAGQGGQRKAFFGCSEDGENGAWNPIWLGTLIRVEAG